MIEVPLNEDIIYCTRKSPLGLVAVLGDISLWCFTVGWILIKIYEWTDTPIFLSAFYIMILPLFHVIYQIAAWHTELHVVTSFRDKEGGVYRKIWGVFNQNIKDTPITRGAPDLPRQTTFWLRIWAKMTGQRVTKMWLYSESNTVIVADIVPERLYKAIVELRGEPPRKLTQRSNGYDLAQVTRAAYHDGIISRDKAAYLLDQIIGDQ